MFSLYYAYTVTLYKSLIVDVSHWGFGGGGGGAVAAPVFWWLMSRIQRSGVRAPLGSNRDMSLSKAHLIPKSTGNTQEAVALSNMTEKLFTGTLRIIQPTNHRGFKGRILVLIEPLTLNFSTYLNK